MKKKYSNTFYIGLALSAVGAVMFFSRVRIGSYLFPRFGSFDTPMLHFFIILAMLFGGAGLMLREVLKK